MSEMECGLPTPEQYQWASAVMRRQREMALERLLTGEHIEQVASLVFSYCDSEETPTAGDVAHEIIRYLSISLAPLMADALTS